MSNYPSFTLEDFRRLPDRLVLVRHAESAGNLDATRYAETPDYEIPLSAAGHQQAAACGAQIRGLLEAAYGPGTPYKLHFVTSPYTRSRQTFVGLRHAFLEEHIAGVNEAVQLREQDFGNFQVPHRIAEDIKERNRFGRFYYRFPEGESTADVYNRVAIFEDNLLRDIRAGEFGANSTIVLVSHGLTLRVFLMHWFNWSVEQFLQVYNPPNALPLLIRKVSEEDFMLRIRRHAGKRQTLQIKSCYELDRTCMVHMRACVSAGGRACDRHAEAVPRVHPGGM
ncbi:MAG: histidine phosphatase superfamily [Monoraphidium minutum]|nr:MAG: histidine phosphatase superfamily [Monoraphidium minutum]